MGKTRMLRPLKSVERKAQLFDIPQPLELWCVDQSDQQCIIRSRLRERNDVVDWITINSFHSVVGVGSREWGKDFSLLPTPYSSLSHTVCTNLVSNAARRGISSMNICLCSACAPAPSTPRPSRVGSPMAAVKLPSEPPPAT